MSTQGPWGGGDKDDETPRGGNKRPPEGQIPEIDELVKRGSEQLRVLMGGKSGGGRTGGRGPATPEGPAFTPATLSLGALALLALWTFASVYTVRPEERSVELRFGQFSGIGEPGLNFAPWPVITAETVQVTRERTTDIGTGGENGSGLMLTRDQNIVDVEFQVVWNISSPQDYLFNLADPDDTIRAVAESAMRDIIARSELAPILNRDRGAITAAVLANVQGTLDSYKAGIKVRRVNFNRADPPQEVLDSFRDVQAAQQERDRLEKQADAYANTVTAGARGQAAQVMEEAEAYRARVVNEAQGEAARFNSVFAEYVKAPEVTRKRMYLETMEKVLGGVNKTLLDGEGAVPYLPLEGLKPAGAK